MQTVRQLEFDEEATAANRTLDGRKKLGSVGPRWPTGDFEKLQRNVATFCALLWTLFGEKSDYFLKCLGLLQILESDPVESNDHQFTPLLCRQITWAIIQDSRAFFSRTATPDMFAPGRSYRHPVSLLESIFDKVHFQENIE